VEVLTSHVNIEKLFDQAGKVSPEFAVITGLNKQSDWEKKFHDLGVKLLFGEAGLLETAYSSVEEVVVNALVGSAGLKATLKAVEAGKDIALANKEVLVMAGSFVSEKVREKNVKLLPIDSEHSAIFQCLAGEEKSKVKRLILTASGGPFFNKDKKELEHATVKDALAHPNWSMGRKVTIDSATMMNKGLEVIEARYLFDIHQDKIDIVVHPQSIIHSMVEFRDGSIKAQLGNPDMHVPIMYALSYPDRWQGPYGSMDFSITDKLTFAAPDFDKFPCLNLAFHALGMGGTGTAALNGADEAAVDLFLRGIISFSEIPAAIEHALSNLQSIDNPEIEDILKADEWARDFVYKNWSKDKE